MHALRSHIHSTHYHHKRGPPRGCSHIGLSCSEAGDRCSCYEANVTCEKLCACPEDCKTESENQLYTALTLTSGYLKFLGCACVGADCSDLCACRLLNRECDPDLCMHDCQNSSIQDGRGKMCVIGESPFGLGLFAA